MPRTRRSLGVLVAAAGAGLLALAPALPAAAAEWDPDNPTSLPLDATSVTVTGSCDTATFPTVNEAQITWGTLTAPPDGGGATIAGPYQHDQPLDPGEAPAFTATIDLTQLDIPAEEGNYLVLTLQCVDSIQGGEGNIDSAPGWLQIVYGDASDEEEPETPGGPDDPGGSEDPALPETGVADGAAGLLAAAGAVLLLGGTAVVAAGRRSGRRLGA